MPITQKFIVMCDEVRVENNGKFFIIGMYTPDMAVFQLPYACPVLTFLLWLEGDRPGNFQFTAQVSHLESGSIVAQAMGGIGFQKPGQGITPIRLVNVGFLQPGPYVFAMKFSDGPEFQHHFQVILSAPIMPGTLRVPGVPGI